MSRLNLSYSCVCHVSLLFMKFREFKSLHWENKKIDRYKTLIFLTVSFLILFDKIVSKTFGFFIDVIRLEFGKGLQQ